MKYDAFRLYDSPIGKIVMFSRGGLLTGLCFQETYDEDYDLSCGSSKVLEETCRWLDIYFSGTIPDFDIPIMLEGTDFQKRVWEHVRDIPYGETVSYGDIAAMMAKERNIPRMSNQAVGTAVGKNKISIIVPCHRVINADGRLGQYGGNEDRKLYLLQLEGHE
ncbi:MAG: methylated-DNA--[Erysipelotrichaceae bacterium]|nr:methylated-DNA--[protein]-cysteine S-methyltransferase [Erysipelotrichaceae bacterium]